MKITILWALAHADPYQIFLRQYHTTEYGEIITIVRHDVLAITSVLEKRGYNVYHNRLFDEGKQSWSFKAVLDKSVVRELQQSPLVEKVEKDVTYEGETGSNYGKDIITLPVGWVAEDQKRSKIKEEGREEL